jgi:hypothetical protein
MTLVFFRRYLAIFKPDRELRWNVPKKASQVQRKGISGASHYAGVVTVERLKIYNINLLGSISPRRSRRKDRKSVLLEQRKYRSLDRLVNGF